MAQKEENKHECRNESLATGEIGTLGLLPFFCPASSVLSQYVLGTTAFKWILERVFHTINAWWCQHQDTASHDLTEIDLYQQLDGKLERGV